MALQLHEVQIAILVIGGLTSVICLTKTIHLFVTKKKSSFNRLKEAIHIATTAHAIWMTVSIIPYFVLYSNFDGSIMKFNLALWYIIKNAFISITYTIFSISFMLLLSYWIGMYQDIFTISKGHLLTKRTRILFFSLLTPTVLLCLIHFIGSVSFSVSLRVKSHAQYLLYMYSNISIIILSLIFIIYSLYVLFFEKRVHSLSRKMKLMIARGIIVSFTYVTLCIIQLPHIAFYGDEDIDLATQLIQCIIILEVQLLVYFDWLEVLKNSTFIKNFGKMKCKFIMLVRGNSQTTLYQVTTDTTQMDSVELPKRQMVDIEKEEKFNDREYQDNAIEMKVINDVKVEDILVVVDERKNSDQSVIDDDISIETESLPSSTIDTPDIIAKQYHSSQHLDHDHMTPISTNDINNNINNNNNNNSSSVNNLSPRNSQQQQQQSLYNVNNSSSNSLDVVDTDLTKNHHHHDVNNNSDAARID